MTRARLHYLLVVLLLCVGGARAIAGDEISRSPKLPETTPWDLKQLSKPPAFTWVDATGPVRSLFFDGEMYHGMPTRVFAYYATPGTLAGKTTDDKNLPA